VDEQLLFGYLVEGAAGKITLTVLLGFRGFLCSRPRGIASQHVSLPFPFSFYTTYPQIGILHNFLYN